jgi:hypothetical protein
MTPLRAIMLGPLFSTTSSNASTAACHSASSCSALKLLDIFSCVLKRNELPTAWKRDRIVERTFPPPAANGVNPSRRSRPATGAFRPSPARCTTDRARRQHRKCRHARLPTVEQDGFHTPSRNPRTECISWLPGRNDSSWRFLVL